MPAPHTQYLTTSPGHSPGNLSPDPGRRLMGGGEDTGAHSIDSVTCWHPSGKNNISVFSFPLSELIPYHPAVLLNKV